MAPPVCPTCENTEYEERNGFYFCTLCNQQSQEMGRVEIIDPDAALSIGMSYRKTISLSESSRKKSSKDESARDNTERWSTVEGYSQILNRWCTQLEKIGITGTRDPVLNIWATYLQKLGAAFTRSHRDDRSVDVMSYRDQWNYFNGPERVREKHFIENILGGAKRRTEAKRKRIEDIKREEDDIDNLNEKEVRKRRNKKRRAFFKSFSESFVTDTESEAGYNSGPGASSSDHGKGDSSGNETKKGSSSSGPETDTLNYESGTDLASVIVAKQRSKTPSTPNLRYVRAVLTLAVTSLPDTRLTSSDLACLFSSNLLAWATSIQALPREYRPHIGERNSFSGFISGLQLVLETQLREEALELANYLDFKSPIRLFVCSPPSFKAVLDRYIQDLCLPSCLVPDIIRTFSGCDLMTMKVDVLGRNSSFPCVSARVLALIIIALKHHCGLDDVQEYYYDKIAEARNSIIDDELEDQREGFSLISWIRLSKLRLDYLISNDMTVREQFKTFRHVGVPPMTLQSMDEARVILDKTNITTGREIPIYEELKNLIDEFGSGEQLERRPRLESLFHLEERTNILLSEIQDMAQECTTFSEREGSTLREKMLKLLSMKEDNMDIYYVKPSKPSDGEDEPMLIELPDNVKKIATVRIDRKLHGSSVRCSTAPSSGIKQVPTCSSGKNMNDNSGDFKFVKRYWMSPFTVTPAKGRKFHFRKAESDDDFWNHIQFLPSNYLWILKYFASYAIIPLYFLEREVEKLEEYIHQMDDTFFGKSVQSWTQNGRSKKRQKDNREASFLQDFEYCGCELCLDIDKKYPKESKRMT